MRPRRFVRWGIVVVCVGSGIALSALPASGRSVDVGCPAAPSGWTSSPQNPQLWGPAQSAGLDSETVNCIYANSSGLTLTVRAQFALPIDMNPVNDFFYGCGTQSVPWNASDREYLLASADRWSYVVFQDPESILSNGDVSAFETLSHSFLQSTQSAAHTCTLKVAKTAVTNRWQFAFSFALKRTGFSASGLVGSHTANQIEAAPVDAGSIETLDTGNSPKVKAVTAPPIQIAVTEQGKKYSVTIRLTQGLSYTYREVELKGGIAATKASLKAKVSVVRSTEPSCRAKSTGTLAISTLPAVVSLDLCGSLFRAGKHTDVVYITQG